MGNQPLQEGTNTKEKSLLHKSPKFVVTLATIHVKENFSTTHVAALQADKLNSVDCSGLCHDGNRILNTYTNKPIHTNITKAEHLAPENLRRDKDHIIVIADKSVDLVLIDKTECITKCETLIQDNSVYQHLSKTYLQLSTKNSWKFCKIIRIKFHLWNKIHPTKTSWFQLPSSKLYHLSKTQQKQHAYAPHSFSLWHRNIQDCQIHH